MEEILGSLTKEEILELLSHGFCHHCKPLLHARFTSLLHKRKLSETSSSDESFDRVAAVDISVDGDASNSKSLTRRLGKQWGSPKNSFQMHNSNFELLLNDGISEDSSFENGLSEEQKECIRYSQVHRNKDFALIENVNGRYMNVLQGLELHTGVFNSTEQKKILENIYRLQWKGQHGKLRERTYSEPRKWMRGKGRITIQFGCCYNYAVDKKGNPPGIVRDVEVDPLPDVFKQMIKRMVRWNIIPSTCIPDSCIVNIYEEGDCIPPHIDHHDFVRPFYTVSFLNECKIVFGSNLQVVSPGQFSGPASISLPVGSVFILNGKGADVAKHCIPSVTSKRISITFRKMDDSKLPFMFSPDPDLMGIKPLILSPLNKSVIQHDKAGNLETQQQKAHSIESESSSVWKTRKELFHVEDEFPPPNGNLRKLKVTKFG